MPRLRKTRDELADEHFRILMRRRIHGSRYETIEGVAAIAGVNRNALSQKIRDPSRFKLGELRELYDHGMIEEGDVVALVTRKDGIK